MLIKDVHLYRKDLHLLDKELILILLSLLSILLLNIIVENNNVMLFENEWTHQYQGYEGEHSLETSLLFQKIDDGVVFSGISGSLVFD